MFQPRARPLHRYSDEYHDMVEPIRLKQQECAPEVFIRPQHTVILKPINHVDVLLICMCVGTR